MKKITLAVLALVGMAAVPATAQDLAVKINGEIGSVTVETVNGRVEIMRNQDLEATINPSYARTSRQCPPFCVQPMQAAPGVTTVAEVELLKFIDRGGKLIDSRTLEWHLDGTIPSAINMPYTQMASRLNEVGCTGGEGRWDCSQSEEVLLFCNGPWCGQSPMAIKAMLREGFPAEKIFYYRGGMQAWHSLGLTVVEGEM
ncbi:rhodanese-like domain-containing protein [Pseudophaeobacter sp. EL27]|uniref:rhodanese-like domain-containing protein n=1 Tax=Pseudophaeobacter sp. EL27 TaxID=2107580 RepID=UPI000EFD047D|nr:rhodanese-like domain-containing protein [Pseudophaeobacter sp. EL27]